MTTSSLGGRFGLQDRSAQFESSAAFAWPRAGASSLHFLALADLGLLAFAAWMASALRIVAGTGNARALRHDVAYLLLYLLLFLLFALAANLYAPRGRAEWSREFAGILKVSLGASAALGLFVAALGDRDFSPAAIAATLIFSVLLLLAWRAFLRFPGISGLTDARNVLIVGAGAEGQALQEYLARAPELGFSVIGYADRRSRTRLALPDRPRSNARLLGPVSELDSIVRTHFIDEILITLPGARDLVEDVVARARPFGARIRVVPGLYGGLALGAPPESVGGFPALTLCARPAPALQLTIKRLADLALSALALAALGPFFLVIAALIKLDSEGPVFYNSVRVGKKGKAFVCHKFRSMAVDAERRKESLQHLNERRAILFKISNDPRVTRLGRFLRKWSLDELPQLWNVLKGEMSLVGPRPPIPEEFEQYSAEHMRRLEVVPGLTGLWQVERRGSPYFEDYIELDLEYVDRWSVWLDFALIAKTFYVVLGGTGR